MAWKTRRLFFMKSTCGWNQKWMFCFNISWRNGCDKLWMSKCFIKINYTRKKTWFNHSRAWVWFGDKKLWMLLRNSTGRGLQLQATSTGSRNQHIETQYFPPNGRTIDTNVKKKQLIHHISIPNNMPMLQVVGRSAVHCPFLRDQAFCH